VNPETTARAWRVADALVARPDLLCGVLHALRDARIVGAWEGRDGASRQDPRTGQPAAATWNPTGETRWRWAVYVGDKGHGIEHTRDLAMAAADAVLIERGYTLTEWETP